VVRVRIGNEVSEWPWDEWDERVRTGRVPPNAEVCIPALTGTEFVRADSLESYRALADDAEHRWQANVVRGMAPIGAALLVGVQIRIWWWQFIPALSGPILDRGISYAPAIYEDGESWRWLTMGLLHREFGHAAMNLIWLAYVGWNVERALGRANLFAVYFASVLGGSILSTVFAPWTPSLGASGGVFGLIAATTVFGLTRPELLPSRVRNLFGLAMLPYMLISFWSGLQSKQTDNWAHFGGLATGAILAWLLDPSSLQRRPGWNRRWYFLLAALGAFALAVPAICGPRVHPLVEASEANRRALKVRGEHVEVLPMGTDTQPALQWSVPAGWQPGSVTSAGDLGFGSPLGGRVWAVRERHHDHPVSVDALALDWISGLQRAFPDLEVSDPGAATLATQPAARRVALAGPRGETRRLEWRAVARGHWSLEAVWETPLEETGRLEPLAERLLATVGWAEPPDLVAARAAHAANPQGLSSRIALAQQLGDAGEIAEAGALWDALRAERPNDEEVLVGILRFVRSYSDAPLQTARLEPLAREILAGQPSTDLLVELVATWEAQGQTDPARGLLDLAWALHPGDRDLRRARKARGLGVELDPTSATPVERLVDPWGRPRPTTPLPPLSLDATQAAGAAIAAERARLVAEAEAGLAASANAAAEPLLRLKHGGLPADRIAALAGLAEDLRTVTADRDVAWMPASVYRATQNRLHTEPTWPETLIPAPPTP
jgi:membrane associated rhomboid family serine protease